MLSVRHSVMSQLSLLSVILFFCLYLFLLIISPPKLASNLKKTEKSLWCLSFCVHFYVFFGFDSLTYIKESINVHIVLLSILIQLFG